MRRICVFCGSSPGSRPEYGDAAVELGRTLAEQGIGLVYGGADVGTMGILAHAVLENGGEVIGVIPKALVEKEVAFTALDDLRIVNSMHERKALMAELSDGFIALPGGLGTIEEFVESLTWTQLGIHRKPCGLLDVRGYFQHLIAFLDHMTDQKFLVPAHREMVIIDSDPQTLLEKFAGFQPPVVDKADWAIRLNSRAPQSPDFLPNNSG
ncbi:MAG: TIGR00730 family Rossman fold protein [Thermodesulfobacteriota bacterium]